MYSKAISEEIKFFFFNNPSEKDQYIITAPIFQLYYKHILHGALLDK